ncbi:MAG: formate C-acetyltransferase [Armatimonadetes bacterium]|nr:formate C-acetyltransferase [Armatimonadota bacterium]
MNDRINKLRERVLVDEYPLCIEKACIVIDSFKRTEGQPKLLAAANAFAEYLDKRTIFIEDDELIVGNVASKPMGIEADHLDTTWPKEDFKELRQKGLTISERDEETLRATVDGYHKGRGKTFFDMIAPLIDDVRLWPFLQSGIMLPPWRGTKNEGYGHGGAGVGWAVGQIRGISVVDFAKALNGGLGQLTEQAEEELSNTAIFSGEAIRKKHFLQAVITANRALVRAAHRYADLAGQMASVEADPRRKAELELIEQTCRWVPENRPRTFYEAMQFFWFIWLAICGGTSGGGRFDQYMYPFYKADRDAGRITDEGVLELLEAHRVKSMQTSIVFGGKIQRDKWAGYARWHNYMIGGVDPHTGEDCTNELSYLLLEAVMDCPTPHYTITLRVHDGTPTELMLKAIQCIKSGTGMPAFVGDKSYVGFLVGQGVSLEDARNYVLGGCLDVNVPGKSGVAGAGMFVVPLVFEIFMNDGLEKRTGRQLGLKTGPFDGFSSFEDLMADFKKQMYHFMTLSAEYNNIWTWGFVNVCPDPFGSLLMDDAIKVGRDTADRKLPFENGETLNPVGMINVVDSLAAIKLLVFMQQRTTLKELKAALEANWEGYEELHKLCLNAPKYGNGDSFVDSIARELYEFYAESIVNFGTVFGGKTLPGGVSITSHGPAGALTGATPDGRYEGEYLADGTMSPAQGKDVQGPTAVLRSAMAIDQVLYSSTLLNMKFHPTSLQSTSDMEKLASLLKTYFSENGKHVQFNVVDKALLREAQEHPEKHRDLIVRVAGYSAYFVQLTKIIQDEIISRTEH